MLPAAGARAGPSGYAIVHDDGSLTVDGERLILHDIQVSLDDRTCLTHVSPIRCGPRAVLQLDLWLQGFVHCNVIHRYRNASSAVCRYRGTDLAAWLLDQGWAATLSGAPPGYRKLEQAARRRGLGIWGLPADRLHRR